MVIVIGPLFVFPPVGTRSQIGNAWHPDGKTNPWHRGRFRCEVLGVSDSGQCESVGG